MVKKKILVDANNLYEIARSEHLPYADLDFQVKKQWGNILELAVSSQIVFFVGVQDVVWTYWEIWLFIWKLLCYFAILSLWEQLDITYCGQRNSSFIAINLKQSQHLLKLSKYMTRTTFTNFAIYWIVL